jgi:hypothetical protein
MGFNLPQKKTCAVYDIYAYRERGRKRESERGVKKRSEIWKNFITHAHTHITS